jgi:SAM-dependent methyltransferase
MIRAARHRLDRYRLKDLLKIYRSRDDLIRAFPEVVRGEMSGLLRWAVRTGAGIDSSRPVLERHIQTYREILLRSRDEIVRRSRSRWQRYVRGIGIDVGPLHLPFSAGRNYELLATDVLSPRRLYEHYPEFLPEELTIPNILCEAEGFLPFRPESLDFVILSHVLEHLSNSIGAVENMIRVCKSGGMLIMAVPSIIVKSVQDTKNS